MLLAVAFVALVLPCLCVTEHLGFRASGCSSFLRFQMQRALVVFFFVCFRASGAYGVPCPLLVGPYCTSGCYSFRGVLIQVRLHSGPDCWYFGHCLLAIVLLVIAPLAIVCLVCAYGHCVLLVLNWNSGFLAFGHLSIQGY